MFIIFVELTVLYGRWILTNTQRSNCKDASMIANLQGTLNWAAVFIQLTESFVPGMSAFAAVSIPNTNSLLI